MTARDVITVIVCILYGGLEEQQASCGEDDTAYTYDKRRRRNIAS